MSGAYNRSPSLKPDIIPTLSSLRRSWHHVNSKFAMFRTRCLWQLIIHFRHNVAITVYSVKYVHSFAFPSFYSFCFVLILFCCCLSWLNFNLIIDSCDQFIQDFERCCTAMGLSSYCPSASETMEEDMSKSDRYLTITIHNRSVWGGNIRPSATRERWGHYVHI